jgi:hypothetical protein
VIENATFHKGETMQKASEAQGHTLSATLFSRPSPHPTQMGARQSAQKKTLTCAVDAIFQNQKI